MHHSEHPEGGCDGWSRASARYKANAHSSLAPVIACAPGENRQHVGHAQVPHECESPRGSRRSA